MENQLNMTAYPCSKRILDAVEECGVGGDFTLPEYCPDIAVVLKCVLTPYVQNRQWSSERFLVDGVACARVLYLDEGRKCVHSAEFTLPFSCTLMADELPDMSPAELVLNTKYCNCRAVGPRQMEIRGAVTVCGRATINSNMSLAIHNSQENLFCMCKEMQLPYLVASSEKVITVNESLDFPNSLPAAAMLLGGECRAVITDCKLLRGKAIVKGQLYIHQLYADAHEEGSTHSLDFAVPFSQIMDVEAAEEGDNCVADVQLLSDMERCGIGPDGENSVLEISAKLMVQVSVYRMEEISVITDAYHAKYPTQLAREEVSACVPLGCRWEQTVLPMPVTIPCNGPCEVVDVWVTPQETNPHCDNGLAILNGRLLVCAVLRDSDGCLFYHEQAQDYRLEFSCDCNKVDATLVVTDLRYRLVEKTLELQIGLCVAMKRYLCQEVRAISTLMLDIDAPYPTSRATAVVYYAQPGENLWDIGRHCHASVDRICEENGISQKIIKTPSVLLVPTV